MQTGKCDIGSNQSYVLGDPAPAPLPLRTEAEIMSTWKTQGPPLVSILCITYNHRLYIEDALKGFLGQITDFPFEILVRDDASTDGTADIIRNYAARYPTLIRPVLEAANTFSQGIRPLHVLLPLARGQFVAICEGDDYWIDPHKIQDQTRLLQSRPDASAVHHDAFMITDGKISNLAVLRPEHKREIPAKDLQRGVIVCTASILCRREIIAKPEEEESKTRSGDGLLGVRMGMAGCAAYLDGPCRAVYRRHAGGIWSRLSSFQQTCEAIDAHGWISTFHFRTGTPSLGRLRARFAAGKMHVWLNHFNLRTRRWIAFYLLAMEIKRLLMPWKK